MYSTQQDDALRDNEMNLEAGVKKDPLTLADVLATIFAAAGLIGGGLMALKSSEDVMQLHGAILAATCFAFFLIAIRSSNNSGTYGGKIIIASIIAMIFWGIVGLFANDIIAWQLPSMATNLGHLRSPRLSSIIFASGGNALLASSFYVVQRTCRAKLYGRFAPWFVAIGFNTFIVMAFTGFVLGIAEGQEYIEPLWHTDLYFTFVWLTYLIVLLGTVLRQAEGRFHIANWLFLLFVAVIGMLHILNNATIPASFLGSKSYIMYSGIQDAFTQWWYSHWRW